MRGLLPKNVYRFKNIKNEELEETNQIEFYCDNLQEGMHILFWLEEFNPEMNLIKRGYNGISKYISFYNINDKIYSFTINSFYHNGELPTRLRQTINRLDKPDVVVYSKNENKIICAIENTETAFVGNATWQRQGRVISFAKEKIPFIFFAYYSKKDISQDTIRKPSPLFELSFMSLSVQYSSPTILSLFDHPDKEQAIINNDGTQALDSRKESLNYIFNLIVYGNTDERTIDSLKKCFYDMKYYYGQAVGRISRNEIPAKTLNLLREDNFEDVIVSKILSEDKDLKFFNVEDFQQVKDNELLKWNPVTAKEYEVNNDKVGIKKYIENQFPDIEFYGICNKAPVGITFDTQKLINRLNKIRDYNNYFWQDSLNPDYPTIITLLKLTKNGVLSLPDPYNGRIPAFYELYKQSFGKINNIIYLMDHSTAEEYEPYEARQMKIYKAINDYATVLIDRELNIFDKHTDYAVRESRSRYELNTTEDNVTCFFETILKLEDITPSFINPPCGSWSDVKLYPTDKFLYINREDDRPDIAYYLPKNKKMFLVNGVYYIGESKASYNNFRNDVAFNREVERIDRLINKIKQAININNIEYRNFVIFAGKEDDATQILKDIREGRKQKVNYIVVIEEKEDSEYNIIMKIFEV